MWEFSEEEGSQFLTSSISNTALPMFMECSADWMLNGGMPLPAMAIFLPYCSANVGGKVPLLTLILSCLASCATVYT